MLALRSFAFHLSFYLLTAVLAILGLPALLAGRTGVIALARFWARLVQVLLAGICGLRADFRGVENIPSGGYIIAPKHQSAWETLALLRFTPDFTFVLKRELLKVPIFGWYLRRSQQIAIDRSKGASALSQVVAKTRAMAPEGRQIFIFPEGTRRAPGAPAQYKFGVSHIYAQTGARCLPVALDSGLFWPRRGFLIRPGTVLVEFLPAIEPGLDRDSFLQLLQARLEQATDRLIAESIAADPSLKSALARDGAEAAPRAS
jgi:1-acyl-sn-glycerol-3-phosphate acyltransferase